MKDPTTPNPFKKGDWVADNGSSRPIFGTVRDCYECSIFGGWLVDIVLYKPTGERIGRRSDSLGGPTSFEPAISANHLAKIKPPTFPLKLNLYNDWKDSLVFI